MCWAEHATIGSPFLEPGKTVVDMSARQAKTRTHADEQGPQPHRLVNFKDFTWPMAPGLDGQLIDLRAAPLNPNSLDHTKTPEGFQKVDDVILQNGKLDIEDRAAGKRITLPASLGL